MNKRGLMAGHVDVALGEMVTDSLRAWQNNSFCEQWPT